MSFITRSLLVAGVALCAAVPAQVVTTVVNNGPSSELYDMVVLGDGYTAAQQGQFDQDVLDVVNYFRTNSSKYPHNAYFQCYNVHSVYRASVESGADQPPNGIYRNTVYDATYWYGGTERCLYIQNTSQAALDAALAPDTDGRVIVIVNDSKYGGCAGAYSVCYNGTSMEEVQTHEWGHSFGGLADEYDYGSSGTYNGGEFAEPNVTNSSTGNKWQPWLGLAGPNGTIGAYQGGRYYQTGVWRPEPDCQMRSLSRRFCAVCREAMILRFNRYCDMIGQESPTSPTSATRYTTQRFTFVNRLATRPHSIEWRVDGGAWFPGTTVFDWNIGAALLGPHSIAVRLTDTSPDVRRDPSGFRIHTHTWSVNVTQFGSGIGAGVAEILPPTAASIEQNSATDLPFNTTGARVMYAFGRSMLGHEHPVHIAGIAFRPEGGTAAFGPTTFDLRVDASTGSGAAGSLSPTFDSNHGADRSTVFDGPLAVGSFTLGASPSEFVLVIPFSEPFAWDPRSGPLLIDVRARGVLSGSGVQIDAIANTPGADYGRIAHLSNPNATIADLNGGATQPLAATAQLLLETEASPSNRLTTGGNSASALPWGWAGPLRAQFIHDGSTFAFTGRHKITRLAWRTENGSAFAGGTYDLRVTLSTGTPGLSTAPSTAFAANTGADARVVYDGVYVAPPFAGGTAPGEFLHQLELQHAFEYDPASGSLVLEFQLRSVTGVTVTSFDAETASAGGFASVVAILDPNAASGTVQNTAPVLGLSGVPSPVLPQSLDSMEGSGSDSNPWDALGPMRVMTSYAASALGVSDPVEITHLGWRPDAAVTTFGPVTFQARIDLSSGGSTTLGTTFAQNHGPDVTTVFNGTFSVPRYFGRLGGVQDHVVSLRLDHPFRWDPNNGPLIVDIRKDSNPGGVTGAPMDAAGFPGVSQVVHRFDANAAIADLGPLTTGMVLHLGGSGSNGTVTPYGSGCTGSLGMPVNSSIGLPWLGNSEFACAVFEAQPSTAAILLWGVAAANTPLVALGAPTCALLHDVALGSVSTITDASGTARYTAPIPDLALLAGVTLRSQWLVIDPGGHGTPVAIAMSDGAAILLR